MWLMARSTMRMHDGNYECLRCGTRLVLVDDKQLTIVYRGGPDQTMVRVLRDREHEAHRCTIDDAPR
jgi:hypothetical protein